MFTQKTDLFFDLDHTLWDFAKNAKETLDELYYKYRFDTLFGSNTSDTFIDTYTQNNHRLWAMYHQGTIDKMSLCKARFRDTFTDLGVDPSYFPTDFEEEYLQICPTKPHLFPYTHETLSYLENKYTLHLITNGFKEASITKVDTCGLRKYFKTIVISELIGVNKPDPKIFDHAIHHTETQKAQSLMIGDNLDADIRGALRYGMDAVYFNPIRQIKPADIPYEIHCLSELQSIF